MENFDKIFEQDTDTEYKVDEHMIEKFRTQYVKFAKAIPFQVVEFANSLGIGVYLSDNFGSGERGKIQYDEELQRYKISVNVKDSSRGKMFTIAHEIAHAICDSEYLKTEKILTDGLLRRDSNKREVRANKFAAELLMPEGKFKEKWEDLRGNIKKIADYFDVSEVAITVRASNLFGVIF